jgi:hypothetical protein
VSATAAERTSLLHEDSGGIEASLQATPGRRHVDKNSERTNLHDTDLEAENSRCMGHRDRRAALRVFPTALLK